MHELVQQPLRGSDLAPRTREASASERQLGASARVHGSSRISASCDMFCLGRLPHQAL